MGVIFVLVPHRPPFFFPLRGGFTVELIVEPLWRGGGSETGGGTTVGSSLPNIHPGGVLNVATGIAVDGAEERGGAPGILPGSETTLSPIFLPDLVDTLTGTDMPSWHFSPAPLHSKSFSPNTPPPRVHPYGGVFLSIQVRGITLSLLRELSGCFSPIPTAQRFRAACSRAYRGRTMASAQICSTERQYSRSSFSFARKCWRFASPLCMFVSLS